MASRSHWGRLAIILYLFVVHLLALFFVLDKINEGRRGDAPGISHQGMRMGTDTIGMRGVRDAVSIGARAAYPAGDSALAYPEMETDTGRLLIPVAGVRRAELQDTYTQSRSGGRTHNAIDIMAPEGTPVVAVADGEIAKLFDSKQGGTTIYQWGPGRSRVYYYAHLQRRAEGIREHMPVRRGAILGYVGNTGNAGPGNYHLHFSVMIPSSPDRHWDGTEINPYPLLKYGIEVPAARK